VENFAAEDLDFSDSTGESIAWRRFIWVCLCSEKRIAL